MKIIELPSWVHHPKNESRIVNTKNELDDALSRGFCDVKWWLLPIKKEQDIEKSDIQPCLSAPVIVSPMAEPPAIEDEIKVDDPKEDEDDICKILENVNTPETQKRPGRPKKAII